MGPDLDLRAPRRDALVETVKGALKAARPASDVRLRGSLADGTAGPFSDIDLSWVVPDADFLDAVQSAPAVIGAVLDVESVRIDPDLARSDRRRLIFLRLGGVPLFWRVDLDVRASSIADIADYDDDNPLCRDEHGWSRPESALSNAIGAVKELHLGALASMEGLVARAYERIGRVDTAADERASIVGLIDSCVDVSPELTPLADQVRDLLDVLGAETPLAGGYINDVVRIGATVRRPVGPNAPFVHRLLDHLAAVGYTGAPRLLGTDRAGREVLGYIEGTTASGAQTDPDALASAMQLMRGLHDATLGYGAPGEVVCHNDLSPRNTIYRDGHPVAFIDWDMAAPGAPLRDVAHACWQFLDFGYPGCDAHRTGELIGIMCDAYGLSDRSNLLSEMMRIQEEKASGIEALAGRGEAAYRRLVEIGAPANIRQVRQWALDHAEDLTRHL